MQKQELTFCPLKLLSLIEDEIVNNSDIRIMKKIINLHLKDGEQSIYDRVKIGCGSSLWKVELSTKELHSKESKDEDKQEQK